jgi:hypothetical protein
VTINYVGHAESWDSINRDGDLERQDCTLRFRREGRTLAVATIGRDLESLKAETELERLRVSGFDAPAPPPASPARHRG